MTQSYLIFIARTALEHGCLEHGWNKHKLILIRVNVLLIATGKRSQDVLECTWTERLNFCTFGVAAGNRKHNIE